MQYQAATEETYDAELTLRYQHLAWRCSRCAILLLCAEEDFQERRHYQPDNTKLVTDVSRVPCPALLWVFRVNTPCRAFPTFCSSVLPTSFRQQARISLFQSPVYLKMQVVRYLATSEQINGITVMPRLTTGIRSQKCVRRFRRCTNVIECTYTNLDSIT